MATGDGEDVQRAQKVTLKRKLTGPPRLLLGKTRTRSVGEDRPETRTNKDNIENTESSPKYSPAAESDPAELTETANMDEEVSSVVHVESFGGRCGAAGEEDANRNRTANRRTWWRRFAPAAVCNRKQKTDVKKERKQQSDCSGPPEGALQDTDAASPNNTEENTEKVSKGKRSFNVKSWPMFRRFLTSSDVRRTHELRRDFDGETSMTFRKKLGTFFTRRGKSRSSGVPLENMEDPPKCEEAPSSSAAQVDQPAELHSDVGSLEVVMALMSVQLTKEPDEAPTEEQLVCDVSVTEEDLTDTADGPDTIQTNSEVVEGFTHTNEDLKDVASSEAEVVVDADQLSARTASSQDASKLQCEEKTGETTSQSLQPSTNGPFIRIELVPPEDTTQEDDAEECWETQNHLLLLSFEHSERQLAQTARSLVRAAMNAAVHQLSREQQSGSDCVHRELGCRDHA